MYTYAAIHSTYYIFQKKCDNILNFRDQDCIKRTEHARGCFRLTLQESSVLCIVLAPV